MTAAIARIFTDAGCEGTLHVTPLAEGPELELDADLPVTPASTMKTWIGLTALIAMAGGELDPKAAVELPADRRTPGPVGVSLMADDVRMSLRDLVMLMLTISDNVATDAVLEAVGLDRVNALTRSLGLTETRIVSDLRTMLDETAVEAGFSSYAALAAHDPARGGPDADEIRVRIASSAALDPARGSRTTARDCTRLLQAIWQDRAGPPSACGTLRTAMAQQLTRHRIASGFPPEVLVAAKSGGLMGVVRNEIGVVTLPHDASYAVAVFTRSDPRRRADPRLIDAAIGAAAAHAVALLQG